MNKRRVLGLILGISLLFCTAMYLHQGKYYKVEALGNVSDVTGYVSTGEVTDSSAQTNMSEETDPSATPSMSPASDPTGTPSVTNTPMPSATPAAPKATVTPKPTTQPIAIGWNKTDNGKKYYIKKNGKRAKGYKTIDGDGYYFNSKGYMITKQWKYVKLQGKNYKLYFGKNGKRKLDVTNLLSSDTYFRLEVNLSKNMVMIYAKDGNKGYTIPVKAMICSVGMPGHRTITGNYSRIRRAGSWHVLRYNSVGQYCTRISGPYLFHSVVYTRYGDKYSLHKAEYRKLGKSASHGCIRLQVADAKWIYDRAYRCSVSLYYDKDARYPLKKPKAEKIGKNKDGRYYDPTDPALSGKR